MKHNDISKNIKLFRVFFSKLCSLFYLLVPYMPLQSVTKNSSSQNKQEIAIYPLCPIY